MIVIYNEEHLARALWDSAERAFEREQLTEHRKEYKQKTWDQAHELDRQEMLARAREIVENCQKQAQALTK
jgi:hypothetical protein